MGVNVKKFNTKGKGMKPFVALPADKYLAEFSKAIEKPNSKKTGTFVEITWKVLKGEFKDKTFKSRLNLNNPNDQAVEIAQDEYVTISLACGFKKTEWNTDKLMGKRALVTLIQVPSDRGGFNNECKNYENPKDAKSDGGSENPWADEDKKDKSGKKDKASKGKKDKKGSKKDKKKKKK